MNDYEYLRGQLDLLIGFLDVSDENVYNQIKNHDRFNLGITIEQLYESKYENYSNHIASSALLLGFAHFEDFLSKSLVKLFIKFPNDNTYKVTYKVICEKGGDLIGHLAEQHTRQLTFSDKLKTLKKLLSLEDDELIEEIRFVSDLRNCLMHNNGIADNRLRPIYQENQKITLTSGLVNGYGLKARRLSEMIWLKLNLKLQ